MLLAVVLTRLVKVVRLVIWFVNNACASDIIGLGGSCGAAWCKVLATVVSCVCIMALLLVLARLLIVWQSAYS